jgi:hypothetical protein
MPVLRGLNREQVDAIATPNMVANVRPPSIADLFVAVPLRLILMLERMAI